MSPNRPRSQSPKPAPPAKPNNPFRSPIVVVHVSAEGYGLRAFSSFMTYARERGWTVRVAPDQRWWEVPSFIESVKPDGAFVQMGTRTTQQLLRTNIPVVNISAAAPNELPLITMDNTAVGATAAHHLIDRGFTHLACLARDQFWYSQLRRQGFTSVARAAGLDVHHQDVDVLHPKGQVQAAFDRNFTKWIASLPKPLGLFLVGPQRRALGPLIRECGAKVPDDVALITTGDDPLRCECDDPPVSSVDIPAEQVGFQAALLLERLMRGEPPPTEPLLLPPLGVTARLSSDAFAIKDEDVVDAARFIQQNAPRGIHVSDVLNHVPISRRSLQTRFAKAFGRTVSEEILRRQLEQARFLLSNTDLPIDQVAARSGLVRAQRLCNLFQKHFNTTPRRFRLGQRHKP